MSEDKKIVRYIDLVFYFMILPLMMMFTPIDKLMSYDRFFFISLMVYLFVVYFTNSKFNIVQFLMERKYLQSALVLTFLFSLTYLLTLIPSPDIPASEVGGISPEFRYRLRVMNVRFVFLIMMSIGIMKGMLVALFRQIIFRQAMEAEKNHAQLALYKAQINPHFLFNTLNTLYGLLITHSDRAEEVFVKFSDILKYMYSNAQSDQIAISEEVEYIKQYIDLVSLRVNSHTKVEFKHHIDDPTVEIAPMIIITFVENAFKYGSSSSKDSKIEINLTLKNGAFSFSTKNVINQKAKRQEQSSGIGIKNCESRLKLLYGSNYSLKHGEYNSQYHVLLTIDKLPQAK